MTRLTPIDLYDDGVRVTRKGTTQAGSYPIIVQHNPDLIAFVIQEKRRRQLIQEANWRQWG